MTNKPTEFAIEKNGVNITGEVHIDIGPTYGFEDLRVNGHKTHMAVTIEITDNGPVVKVLSIHSRQPWIDLGSANLLSEAAFEHLIKTGTIKNPTPKAAPKAAPKKAKS